MRVSSSDTNRYQFSAMKPVEDEEDEEDEEDHRIPVTILMSLDQRQVFSSLQ